MVTLSLDEAGVFEKSEMNDSSKDSNTTLIGGILFDDKDATNELANEEKRIEAYYRKVIERVDTANKELSVVFPKDLHTNKGNNRQVGAVKAEIEATLPEFIQNGTFENKQLSFDDEELPPRVGEYIICSVVKSAEGKKSLLKNIKGDFFDDETASNTYYHMASEVVEHIIFHNPLYPNGMQLRLDIATRQSGMLTEEEAKVYKEMGARKNDNTSTEEQVQFSIMNADVFRTILTEQMLNERSNKVEINQFKVKSISYYKKKSYREHVFLYMADTICSFLTYQIGDDDVAEVRKRAQRLINRKNLIFAYDEIDLYFKRAWQDMEVKEYYDALKEIYRIDISKSTVAQLYRDYWCSYIKDRIKSETKRCVDLNIEPHALSEAISELRSSFATNTLNLSENDYIFRVLEQAAKPMANNFRYGEIMYALSDVGVFVNCQKGEFKKAEKWFKECEKYSQSVSVEDYIRTRNQYTNALMDSFAYEDAIRILRVTLELAEGLYDLSKKVMGGRRKNQFGQLALGTTLSQAGQAAAFLGDEEALDFFDEAMGLMRDDIDNRKITESYRLHYLIEKGDKEAFKVAMADYNDGFTTLKSQIKTIRIMSEKEAVNISYALYVLLKGLDRFYTNSEISKVWNDLRKLVDSVDDIRKLDHPWQLIYKYMAMIAIRMDERTIAKKYMEKISDISTKNNDSLVRAISLYGEAKVTEALGDVKDADEKYTKLFKKMENDFQLFKPEGVQVSGTEEKKRYLNSKMCYMFS